MRRTFTLLETVVAAAVLAMLAASSISALRTITLSADRSARIVDIGALSLAVDSLLSEPAAHGLPELTGGSECDGLTAMFPGHPTEVTIRRVVAEPAGSAPAGVPPRPHVWLIFESRGAAVARWLPLSEPREREP